MHEQASDGPRRCGKSDRMRGRPLALRPRIAAADAVGEAGATLKHGKTIRPERRRCVLERTRVPSPQSSDAWRSRIAALDAVDETGAKIKHVTAPSTNTSSVTASARVVWSEGGDVRSSDVRRWALGRDNRWRGGRGARQPLLACCCWLLAAGSKTQHNNVLEQRTVGRLVLGRDGRWRGGRGSRQLMR